MAHSQAHSRCLERAGKLADVSAGPDLTGLLQAWSRGDRDALATLAPLVQRELREMARRILAGERRDGRWRPTELVQESYLRLLDWRNVRWQSRAHFFTTTARMMRRVLVDVARARRAAKRGKGIDAVSLDAVEVPAPDRGVDMIALEDALERLAALNERASRVIELRFFGGFTVEETAEALGISVRTVINDWNTARAWLQLVLAGGPHQTAIRSLPAATAMKPEGWDTVSLWLNAWLAADASERERLRIRLTVDRPDLVAEVEALAAASQRQTGFLETPALVLAATELAQEDDRLSEGSMLGPYRVDAFLARGGLR
jgi:RNA polymerase sigma factor (TIGR02999 family)